MEQLGYTVVDMVDPVCNFVETRYRYNSPKTRTIGSLYNLNSKGKENVNPIELAKKGKQKKLSIFSQN
jgi:hypothetical protein